MKVPFFDIKEQFSELQNEIMEEMRHVFSECCFVNGRYVDQFEYDFSQKFNFNYSVGCGNGTEALVLGLKACGIKPGDEVITTPFSFFATTEAIASIGAVPVFADIRESDYTINPDLIENLITNKTKAILPVHIFGAPCDMDMISLIAKKYNLSIVEDCAQSVGCKYKGNYTGSFGDVGCFSFYPTKNLGGCGDGGMVVTNDENINTIIRALREHGAGKMGAEASMLLGEQKEVLTVDEQFSSELYDPYKYYNYLIGYNSRLDAIQAAVLSIKLKHLDDYNNKRKQIAVAYMNGLTNQVRKPDYSSDDMQIWHQFVIRTDQKNELCKFLAANGVGAGTFYPVPLHRQKAFHGIYKEVHLPVAEMVCSETVCLPIYPEMSDEQIAYVIECVNGFFD